MASMESIEKIFDELMEEDRAAAERRNERAKMESEANRTFKLQTKIRLVEEGKSRIYENWHEHQGITKDDFIRGLEWLCADPLTEDGRVTRDLGCKNGRLYRLERRWGKCGTMSFHDIETDERFSFSNGSGASITVRDRI